MKYLQSLISLTLLPLYTFATDGQDFKGFVGTITHLISLVVYLIFALTFLALIWGIFKTWILNPGDEEGVKNGKKIVLAGIGALVVMSSLWGIVYLIQNSLFGA